MGFTGAVSVLCNKLSACGVVTIPLWVGDNNTYT